MLTINTLKFVLAFGIKPFRKLFAEATTFQKLFETIDAAWTVMDEEAGAALNSNEQSGLRDHTAAVRLYFIRKAMYEGFVNPNFDHTTAGEGCLCGYESLVECTGMNTKVLGACASGIERYYRCAFDAIRGQAKKAVYESKFMWNENTDADELARWAEAEGVEFWPNMRSEPSFYSEGSLVCPLRYYAMDMPLKTLTTVGFLLTTKRD